MIYSKFQLNLKFIKTGSKCWTPENCYENCCDYPTDICSMLSTCVRNMFTCGGCFACCYNCNGFCGPKYSNAALRAALVDRFGYMTLEQVLTPVQIVAYDIQHNRPVYFNSIDNSNMRMVDAALASSAAPTYFPAVTVSDSKYIYNCVDGGLFDNCSLFAVLRFAIQNYEKKFCKVSVENVKAERVIRLDDFTIVSIGTGAKLEDSRVEKLKRAGKLGWVKDAVGISMSGNTQAIHYNMAEIFSIQERVTKIKRYFRFQTIISPSQSQMDDPSKIDIIKGKARKDIFEEESKDYRLFIEQHMLSVPLRSELREIEVE